MKLDDGKDHKIGISNGSYQFITPDEYKTSNNPTPLPGIYSWSPTANGETCVYNANKQIATASSVITVVAVVSLSETSTDKYSLGLGNATLQGFCLEQLAYNRSHKTRPVRILVANIGVQEANDLQQTMPIITSQIIALAKRDKTFIGAVGFTFSASLDIPGGYNTMAQLQKAGIPVISTAAATADFDTMWPGYFYRMSPGNDAEARVAAHFAYFVKHRKTALVFYNKDSSYSKSLAKNFSDAFQSLAGLESVQPHNIDGNDFQTPLQDLVDSHQTLPDMIFCACVASGGASPDFSLFSQAFQSLPTLVSALKNGTIMLMGADGLYNPEGLGITYKDMYFTALAFPDMITQHCMNSEGVGISYDATGCTPEMTDFYANYCQEFATGIYNAPAQSPNETLSQKCWFYGVSRPSKSTMLAYDALSTLLLAYDPSSDPSLDKIRRALPYVAFQGITGRIQFNHNGQHADPEKKAIVVISVDGNFGHMQGYCGEFTPKIVDYNLDPQQQDC
jgi:ABC-type branched-subunit amino acid transport system substrate-binding protein